MSKFILIVVPHGLSLAENFKESNDVASYDGMIVKRIIGRPSEFPMNKLITEVAEKVEFLDGFSVVDKRRYAEYYIADDFGLWFSKQLNHVVKDSENIRQEVELEKKICYFVYIEEKELAEYMEHDEIEDFDEIVRDNLYIVASDISKVFGSKFKDFSVFVAKWGNENKITPFSFIENVKFVTLEQKLKTSGERKIIKKILELNERTK